MLSAIKYTSACTLLIAAISCSKPDYSLGELKAPTDVVINVAVVGQDASHPNGDGSGKVDVTVTGKGVVGYGIDYDASNGIKLDNNPTGKSQKKYAVAGVNTYTITVVAYGSGAEATTVTKDVTVETIFTLNPAIEETVVGTGTRTFKVDGSQSGHLGVGPWDPTNVAPSWWAAAPNEKAATDPCLYSARFKFTKNANGTYTIQTLTPGGAFTKTGALAGGLPGIPASGNEGCYPYAGGTSAFTFGPPGSGVEESKTTLTAITLDGNTTFIGYGAQQKEYEILSFTETSLHLRAQGTEPGNAWYVKLIAE
ncbi:MAG: hypothetical protein EOO09_18825 [Chitinophagaceae bacterium]|nr:MAG: hypothetical protein EOO09_18825 [Chitinophagaceae bacterium]